jgi:kynurenine 3-monooxygenase
MYSVSTDAWHYKDKVLIMGDAAHAVVPFYGMGMNVAFEDCKILNDMIDEFNFDWEKIFSEFYKRRKPEADSIAELSSSNLKNLENSIDDDFDIAWRLERKIWELFPEKWMPVYTMVAFSHVSFKNITEINKKQNYIMSKLLQDDEIRNNFMCDNFKDKLILKLKPLLNEMNYFHEATNLPLNFARL